MVQRRILVFIAVGCCAALVHWAMVVSLVDHLAWPPLAANLTGWLIAFAVSFTGQSALTFRGHGAPFWRTARRFLAVSFAGFLVNEAAYAALLRWSPWRYDVLLAVVLVAMAVFTYLASRRWAFRRT